MENVKLKKEILDSALDYLDKAIVGIDFIIEDFQSGREDKATNSMPQLIEGIQWLVQVIEGTKDVQVNDPIDICDINPILLQLIEGFENNDYVLLGDILEYEIAPVLKDWREKLTLALGVLKNANS